MRILFTVHYFLPRHQAGTEVYAANLARELAREHEVFILASEDCQSGPPWAEDSEFEGIPLRLVYHPGPKDFPGSYRDPALDKLFGEYLDRVKPDIVHAQHLFRLSLGFVDEAKKRGIPFVLTLADYWFICPPILLLKPGYEICPGPDQARNCITCGNAIGRYYAGDVSRVTLGRERLAESLIQAAHALKRRLPGSWVQAVRSIKEKRELADPGSARMVRETLLRDRFQAMQEALAKIDLVIAPSRFMREKMLEAGVVDENNIIHSDYGFDVSRFKGIEGEESEHVRFGFIGTPVEHKGLHVLAEAMNSLGDTEATLEIYGDLSWFPAYAGRIKKIIKVPNTRLMGRFDNSEVGRILSRLDVLAVPSLWHENSPLTIHEAFLAGCPVITSDIGGMAELVEDGVSGLTFKVGDPEDLARAMRWIVEEEGLLKKLRQGLPKVKSTEENAEELLGIYNRLG